MRAHLSPVVTGIIIGATSKSQARPMKKNLRNGDAPIFWRIHLEFQEAPLVVPRVTTSQMGWPHLEKTRVFTRVVPRLTLFITQCYRLLPSRPVWTAACTKLGCALSCQVMDRVSTDQQIATFRALKNSHPGNNTFGQLLESIAFLWVSKLDPSQSNARPVTHGFTTQGVYLNGFVCK